MKRIVASVGLVALGASALNSASAQALVGPDTSKPFSVSATLRGFYDDNPSTLPNDISVKDRDTFGFEVSPSASFKWVMEQTKIDLGFLYSYKYYDTTPAGYSGHDSQTFTFNGTLSHAFSEQLRVRASDSFVIGQEPDMLRAGNSFSTFQRVSGDNIRNYGSLGLDAQVSPTFGIGFGYDNALYDYKNSGATAAGLFFPIIPSISGLLDRIEHRAHIEGLYQIAPETKVLLGYQYTEIDYTADEPISGYAGLVAVMSNTRNSREHIVYVGAEHQFMPNLTGSARVGASYTDYYNDPNTDASYTPYVNATLKYAYMPGSSVTAGFSYDRNATDVVGLWNGGNYTVDAESAVVFAAINHQIDPRFFVNLMAQFQNSSLNGGLYDGTDEQYYLLGLDFEYRFNPFLSAHLGYNYDRLESDVIWSGTTKRQFDRNRVYIGLTASY
jgi:hypothetical protein